MPIKPASVVVEPPLMAVLSAVNSPPLLVGKRQPAGQIDAVVTGSGVVMVLEQPELARSPPVAAHQLYR